MFVQLWDSMFHKSNVLIVLHFHLIVALCLYRFIRILYVKIRNVLQRYILSSANAGGQKRSNQIAIVDNHSAFGRSRVALKTFATEQEAKNFFKYATSEIIRFAFLLTDESLTSLAKKVPDLLDYTDANGVIDYNGDVNTQLYALFGIDDKNQQHIREVLASKE